VIALAAGLAIALGLWALAEPDLADVDERAPMIRQFRAEWEARGRQVKPH
jgi:hypothetical protein